MSVQAFTHTIDLDGNCAQCGAALISHMFSSASVHESDRIGLIETEHGGSRAYQAGENDSNPQCAPVVAVRQMEGVAK